MDSGAENAILQGGGGTAHLLTGDVSLDHLVKGLPPL